MSAVHNPFYLSVVYLTLIALSSTSSAPDSGHQAQGLDVDLLAAAVKIEEPAGPVLVS